eukprot:GHVN01016187.1.p1 GENE.GHVN01016187.1~~GHVN01016187.1.p1  ORF type:complete len:569 (-),score=167.38 GHVN01016187.1:103-1656(-)
MGQEESTPIDPSTLQGFKAAKETNEERRRRKKKEQRASDTGTPGEGGSKKSGDGKRRPRLKDPYFDKVDIGDSIKPIFEREVEDKRAEEEVPVGQIDIAAVVKKYKPKEESEEDVALGFDEPLSSSSDESSDEDRGVFHHEVDQKPKQLSIYDPEAHPISIEGDCSAGSSLKVKDLSEWKNSYTIHTIHWSLSSELGSSDRFSPLPIGEGRRLVVPDSAIGRYIQVKVLRRIEDQLGETQLRDVEGGVFDPHIKGARHLQKTHAVTYRDVASTSVVGPVLISDSAAFTVLKALAKGGFNSAVMLRDEPVADERCNLDAIDGDGVRGDRPKLPGGCTISFDCITFDYIPEGKGRSTRGQTTLTSSKWKQGEAPNDSATGDEEAASSTFRMREVTFRPARSQKTIVMSLAEKKEGASGQITATGGIAQKQIRHDIIRFDVDPAVGRDTLLTVLLAFQAAGLGNRGNAKYWNKVMTKGDSESAKQLVAGFIQANSEATKHDEANFYQEPVTPWEYAKRVR